MFEAEKELDVISIIKKLKIVERSLTKKKMNTKFEPKVLRMKEDTETANR